MLKQVDDGGSRTRNS